MINLLPSRFYCQLTNNHWRSHLCIHMFISLSGCEDHGGDVYWWRRGENFLPLRAFIWYRQPSLLEAPGQSPQVSICPGFISTEQATLSIACGPQQLEALWFDICLFFFFVKPTWDQYQHSRCFHLGCQLVICTTPPLCKASANDFCCSNCKPKSVQWVMEGGWGGLPGFHPGPLQDTRCLGG